MEKKPPGSRKDPVKTFPGSPSDRPDKYKGSREAAQRARAGYHENPAQPRPGSGKPRGGSTLPNLLVLIVAVLAVLTVLALAGYGLNRLGLFDPSIPAGTARQTDQASKPEGAAQSEEPRKPAPPAAAQDEDPVGARNEPAQEAAKGAPCPGTVDLEKELAWWEPIMEKDPEDDEARQIFRLLCLDYLAQVVQIYRLGQSDKANDCMARLDRILNENTLKTIGNLEGLALEGVSAKMVRLDNNNNTLLLKGRIENRTLVTRDVVLLRAVIKDRAGRIIAKSFTIAGRELPPERYSDPSAIRLQTLLNPVSDLETEVVAGSSTSFLFVFSNPPGAAERFSVKVVLASEE